MALKGIFSESCFSCVRVCAHGCMCYSFSMTARVEMQRGKTDLCVRTYKDEALRTLHFLKFLTKPTIHTPHDPKLYHLCIKQNISYNSREHF